MKESSTLESSISNGALAMEQGLDNVVEQKSMEIGAKKSRRRWMYGIIFLTLLTVGIGLAIGLSLRNKNNDNTDDSSRTSWPELVGWNADDAVNWLKERYPNLKVYILEYGDSGTTDYDVNRVRIYTAPNSTTVIAPPTIGR